MLKIGKIKYLNVYPFYTAQNKYDSDNIFVEGEPSYLNELLCKGEIDISPSSSFEYFRNPDKYFIIPDISISSSRKVLSVNLLLKTKLEALENETVYLTPASATSNALIQIILKEFYNKKNVKFNFLNSNRLSDKNHILIGDAALKVYFDKPNDFYIYDIAELWFNATQLPFVFALWMVRKNCKSKKDEINNFIKQLLIEKENLTIPEYYNGFDSEKLKEYFNAIDYNLNNAHIESLSLFAELLFKYDFIKKIPRLMWWE